MSLHILAELFSRSKEFRRLVSDNFQKLIEATIVGSSKIKPTEKRSESHPNKFR